MMNRVYFVEGIPGAGKTTLSQELHHELSAMHDNVHLYRECASNPLDLARYAFLSRTRYMDFLTSVPESRMRSLIENRIIYCNNDILLPYMDLVQNEKTRSLGLELSKYDVYNGHLSFEKFTELHLQRWKAFAREMKTSNEIAIFDGILLQSPLFELMGYFDLADKEILTYIQSLVRSLEDFYPVVYYIKVNNVEQILKNACRERVNSNGKRDWEKGLLKWIENAPYCKKRNFHGTVGMTNFFESRYILDQYIIKNLPIQNVISEHIV